MTATDLDNNDGFRPQAHDFLIVGLGASAGGIQALQAFFRSVPADSGMAYVVILHLSPDHDSKLAEVLQLVSPIPVQRVSEKTTVEPNHVYVVPPNQHLAMQDGYIVPSRNMQPEDRQAPVDIFFRTLANSHGARAVCVVLSGTGANGSMGLKRIKEVGGATFVQSPREAEFNEMPRNAIATDLVDEVLPVSDIPAKIIAYKESLGTVRIPTEPENRPEDLQQALREIFTQLRIITGHDFSNYKRPTLLRRIERRINIRNLPDLPAYAAFIQQNPDEITALLKDLLISVTNFFRDKKAFDAIGTDVLPQLIQSKTSADQLRIWVAGCATGEEAYSLAMLCAEQTLNVMGAPKIQIFATDIDEGAISHGREGYYTINDAADVTPERLRRFFTKEGEGYRIRREIREMILFANHNFIKDPPFSHLDIVSCRNVLIYLNRSAQERVMETFHFALNSGGFLFLGSSESADGATDLYSIFSREHHIFQSRKKLVRSFPVPDSVPTFRIDPPRLAAGNNGNPENRAIDRMTFGDLHQRLLEEYAPPSVVVNEEYEIIHLSERAGRYLQISGGELSQNLLKLVHPELRLELRSALYQATQRQSAVESRALKVNIGDRTETVNIHVRPVLREGDVAQGFILVIFERTEDEGATREVVLSSDEPVARQLEEELIRLKTQLRASIEQHEFHAEELKASNEELQAMNEELRSAAEELETSKEELQSINEELRTVNQELKVKIEETSLTSNNLQNLINSASIGTIFLDRSFRIALFTPAIREIFNLIPGDYGRPLSDITHRLDYDHLLRDAEIVLDRLLTIEREVHTTDGRVFMMRVLPYRTAEDHINGVVVTFIDMTTRKQAEEDLRASEEKYRTVLSTIDDGFCIIEVLFNDHAPVDYRFLEANPAFIRHSALPPDLSGQTIRSLLPDMEPHGLELYARVALTGEAVKTEEEVKMAGPTAWYEINALRIGDPQLKRVAVFFNNITDRKLADSALKESEARFRIALTSAEMAAWDWDVTRDSIIWNDQHFKLLGLDPDNKPRTLAFFRKFIVADDIERLDRNLHHAITTGEPFHMEFRIKRADTGEIRWMNGYGRAVTWSDGKTTRVVGVMYDITNQKNLERQKEEFISIASHELKTPVTSIKTYAEIMYEQFEQQGDHKNAELVQKLEVQVDRLADLVSALLDTSRISEGQLQLRPEQFDLDSLIDERIEEMRRLTHKHTIQFSKGNLPPIVADRERVSQVLINLLSNAIKYSPAGGEILITSSPAPGEVKVSVKDHGIGIPPEMQSKVFERFFRIGNPHISTYPGMGLGLYITSGIIQRHGGNITVESTPGDGTRFTFTLPLRKA